MRKAMRVLPLMLICLMFYGCGQKEESFQNKEQAKKDLIQAENIERGDLLGDHEFNDVYLVLYSKQVDGKQGYAVASYPITEDGKLHKGNVSSKLGLDSADETKLVGTEFKANDSKKVKFAVGKYNKEKFSKMPKEDKFGTVNVNENKGVYYMMDITEIN